MRTSMRWFCGFFLVAWGGVCYPYLKSEFLSIKTAPSLWAMDVVEKKRLIDGPLYEFLQQASDIVPARPNETIYLFAVDTGYTYQKSNYYLYPRSLHLIDPANINPQDLSEGAYFMFYIPPPLLRDDPEGAQRNFDELAGKLPPVVRLYRTPNAGIYRVVSRRG